MVETTGCTYGLYEFCNDCFPEPSNDHYIDPSGLCEHSCRPRDFFERLRSIFPDTGPPKTSLAGSILDRVHRTAPDLALSKVSVRPRNIYSIFFTMPWQRMLTEIPRRCPKIELELSIRKIDSRMNLFVKLRDSKCASMVRLIIAEFIEVHGVSVSNGTYVRYELPGVRQWLPCYAPVQYFSSVEFAGFLAVPMNPRVATLQSLLLYRSDPDKLNGPKVPLSEADRNLIEAQALEESRSCVSDVNLERRIADLDNIKLILGQALLEFCDEDASGFLADIALLRERYSDELIARRDYSTSFVYASYLFAQSSSYETTRGARFGSITFADKFAVAYYRLLEQGYVLSASSAVYCMTPGHYNDLRDCMQVLQKLYDQGTLSTSYACDGGIVRSVCDLCTLGLLTPARLWKFSIRNLSELTFQQDTESLVDWLVLKALL